MRLLILIAAVVMLVFWLRSLLPRLRPQQDKTKKARGNDHTPEKMVACAQCRLYLPESEALSADENFFCNREHYRVWIEDQRAKKH